MRTNGAKSEWHYAHAGQHVGPVDDPTFRACALRGEIAPGDLVWRPGMAQWVQAASIEGLFPVEPPWRAANPTLHRIVPVGRTRLSILAGYLGLLSVIPVFAPVALIVSIPAIRELQNDPQHLGMARAMFGLVMGIIFTCAIIVLGVIAIIYR